MKLVSYEIDGAEDFGAVVDDGIVALRERSGAATLAEFLGRGLGRIGGVWERTEPDLPLGAARLLPPIPRPNKIIGVGLNYREHVDETDFKAMPYPTLFIRFPDSVVASGQPIVRPRNSLALDFEGELAVIIGKGGRHIAPAEAAEHIGGYSCFNDASIRDWQFHTTQVTPGKNFHAVGSFGPWVVTPNALPPLSALRISTRLNGQTMQDASLADMIFSVAELIAYCSAFTPLSPGDVIATGSPAGIGNRRNPKLFMKPGDTVEVEISGIGTLQNPIAAER
ncbi:fumarylacetoacetate hydrolase family protein [Sphingopyxis sp. LARHCG72]